MASELSDAVVILFILAKVFHGWQNSTAGGAYVSMTNAHLHWKVCWVATGSNLNGSQVLFFDLINFQKTNTRRAVGASRAEVFSLKKNQEK